MVGSLPAFLTPGVNPKFCPFLRALTMVTSPGGVSGPRFLLPISATHASERCALPGCPPKQNEHEVTDPVLLTCPHAFHGSLLLARPPTFPASSPSAGPARFRQRRMGSTTHPKGAGLAVSPEGDLEGSRSAFPDAATPARRCRERARAAAVSGAAGARPPQGRGLHPRPSTPPTDWHPRGRAAARLGEQVTASLVSKRLLEICGLPGKSKR